MNKSLYSKDYREIIERLKKARIDSGFAQQAVTYKLGEALPELTLGVSALSAFRSAKPRTESLLNAIHPAG